MSSIYDWLRGEGLSSLTGLARVAGRSIDYRQQRSNSRNLAAVAKFNRQLDLFNLAMNKRHLDYEKRINQRLAEESLMDAQQAQRGMDFFGMEAAHYVNRRDFSVWMSGSELRELELVGQRELDTAFARHHVDRVKHHQNMLVRREREALLDVQREGQAEVEESAVRTLGARRAQRQIGQNVAVQQRDAARGAIAAGRARLGGEAALQDLTAGQRLRARLDQTREEVGAGVVSGAGRGMRGSFRQTQTARALVAHRRDVERFRMEDGLRQLDIAERGMKLTQAEVAAEGQFAERTAALETGAGADR